jgi:Ca2+-binding RTX toxin-like protein
MLEAPTIATAADVAVDPFNPGGLLVADTGGETNAMTVRAESGSLVFEDTDAMPTTSAPQCDVVSGDVRCPEGGILSIRAQLGGGNDHFRLDDSVSSAATVVFATIDGEAGDDELVAGAGTQFLIGGVGNDQLRPGAGDDFVNGLDGNDIVDGGPGKDSILGGSGADQLAASGGDDTVRGEDGADAITGGDGADRLEGGPGADRVSGGEGNDQLEALSPDDDAGAGLGSDQVAGGPGNDRLGAGPEADRTDADVFSGGDGRDTMEYRLRQSRVVVSLDGSRGDGAPGEGDDVEPDIEVVVGGSGGDTITGSPGDNTLDGGPGSDTLAGLGGADTLQGGANDPGGDTLRGGTGTDSLSGGPGEDDLAGGDNRDSLDGEGGGDTLAGDAGPDRLAGGTGGDRLSGGAGDDTVYGGGPRLVGADGDDKLGGGPGDDGLFGGPGDDELDGGSGADRMSGEAGEDDTVRYERRRHAVTVTFDGRANDGERGERDNVAADVENVRGGVVGDTLFGNARPNRLAGGRGEDDVLGGAGLDSLDGGTAGDLLRARDGNRDVVSCGPGRDLAIVDGRDRVRDCEYLDRRGRPPALGRSALVEAGPGRFAFRLPAAKRFFDQTGALRVPIGSTVDARAGAVRLATARNRRGTVQEGMFDGGEFTVRQRRTARPVTDIVLTGGRFARCAGSRARGARAATPYSRSVRRLRGRVGRRRGRYRIHGRYSLGASFGTTWWTDDRCDGTLTRVVKGVVHVRDLVRHRTVVVRAGQSYLARPR